MLRRDQVGAGDVPPGLPDHLRYPVIPLDPDQDEPNRRLSAYAAYVEYAHALTDWIDQQECPADLQGRVNRMMQALGSTLADFQGVAVELPG